MENKAHKHPPPYNLYARPILRIFSHLLSLPSGSSQTVSISNFVCISCFPFLYPFHTDTVKDTQS